MNSNSSEKQKESREHPKKSATYIVAGCILFIVANIMNKSSGMWLSVMMTLLSVLFEIFGIGTKKKRLINFSFIILIAFALLSPIDVTVHVSTRNGVALLPVLFDSEIARIAEMKNQGRKEYEDFVIYKSNRYGIPSHSLVISLNLSWLFVPHPLHP